MLKLGLVSALAFFFILGLFLTSIVIGSNLSQRLPKPQSTSQIPPSTEVSKLLVCPDKWYKNEQPCVYQKSPAECEKLQREYFIINGERKEVEEMDIEWVKENCEVNQPEVVY